MIVILSLSGGAYYFAKIKTPQTRICTMDVKTCPDGSSVGRVGPNCEFAPCPKPSSTSTNETANWKTYTNNEKGYSISFPKDQFVRIVCPQKEFWLEPNTPRFRTQEIIDSEVHINDEECDRNFVYHIDLTTFKKSSYKPPQNDEIFEVKKENITINTMPAIKYTVVTKSKLMDDGQKTLETNWTNQTVIEKGENVYVLSYEKPAWADWDSMAIKILSTFKFLSTTADRDQKQTSTNNSDICNLISNATFRSVDKQNDGLAVGYWTIKLQKGTSLSDYGEPTFQWQYSDVVKSGSYSCKNSLIDAKDSTGKSISATYDANQELLEWDGVKYKKAK